MAQQDNGILAIISTAGFNLNSPFKNEWDYAADILNSKIKMIVTLRLCIA